MLNLNMGGVDPTHASRLRDVMRKYRALPSSINGDDVTLGPSFLHTVVVSLFEDVFLAYPSHTLA